MYYSKTVRILSLFIYVIFIAMMGMACQSGTKDQSATTSGTNIGASTAGSTTQELQQKVYFPLENQIEISVLLPDFGRTRVFKVDQEIEKKTNIKFNWELVPFGGYDEKFTVLMASGKLPDAFMMNNNVRLQYQAQGKFVDFSKYLDKMPNLKAWSEKYPDILNLPKTTEGNVYALTSFTRGGQLPIGYLYRKDIYQKNNIKIPETFDEWYQGLKKLKELYPTVYPVVSVGDQVIRSIYEAYHTSNTIFFDQDNMEYKYGPSTTNFIDALNFARKLYTEKLLDPEFSVTDHPKHQEKIQTGKGFMTIYYIGMNAVYNQNGKSVDPDFNVGTALPPVTETGLQGRVMVQYPVGGWFYTGVSNESKYKEEVVQLLDYQLTDEFTNLVNWGFEGETYTVENNTRKYLPDVRTAANTNGKIVLKDLGIDGRSGIWPIYDLMAANSRDGDDNVVKDTQMYIDNADKIALWREPNIITPKDISDEKAQVMTAVDTLISENTMKYIMGKISIEQMKKIIADVEAKGQYKKYVDFNNTEFAKVKDSFKFDKGIK